MKKVILSVFAVPFILAPAAILAQSGMKPTAATYITDEDVKAVNALPGVDRDQVVDIGPGISGRHHSSRRPQWARGARRGQRRRRGPEPARVEPAAGGAGRGAALPPRRVARRRRRPRRGARRG
jgi:hypothetical protein